MKKVKSSYNGSINPKIIALKKLIMKELVTLYKKTAKEHKSLKSSFTNSKFALILGTSPAEAYKISKGKMEGISLQKMLSILYNLEYNISIKISI